MDLLSSLNEKQREAVSYTDGPLLIIAGPGSGKTKTLVHRIAHLIFSGVPPEAILAVTFTNKAAEEMKTRAQTLLKEHAADEGAPLHAPLIGTFHSICAKILRDHAYLLGYTRFFSIHDEDDAETFMKHLLEQLDISPKQYAPNLLCNIIDTLKEDCVTPDEFLENPQSYPKISSHLVPLIERVYPAYQATLHKQNAMDFSDLLAQTVWLFRKHPDILSSYQNRFQHIMVDEYQDTNRAQYMIVKALSEKNGRLCCVGDESQSIYSWRGADFRNILRFEKDWPQAKIVVLDQSYRSTQTILDVAGGLIKKNTQKKEKNLWTKNEVGERIVLTELPHEREEGEFIVREIERLADEQHIPLKEFAILYRTNAQSRALEEAFLRNDMPYILIGGTAFYQRREVKDLLAYLRILVNPTDALSLKRAVNIPPRGIGKVAWKNIEKLHSENHGDFSTLALSPAAKDFFQIILDLQQKAKTTQPHILLKDLIKKINYQQYLRDGTDKGEERWENVGELVSAAEGYHELPPLEALTQFLERVALAQDADNPAYRDNRVKLMTMHAAKGLEFTAVFVAGCEEGLLPHSRSMESPDALEEERRLCYVAATRAKRLLYFTFARQRKVFGKTQMNPPSSFLFDIPAELLDFHPLEKEYLVSYEDDVIRWE